MSCDGAAAMIHAGTRLRAGRFFFPGCLLAIATTILVWGNLPTRPQSPSWSDLIRPLAIGSPLAGGFVLSPPRRVEANDVVFVARRKAGPGIGAAQVEVHIVDRGQWAGVPETRSFGIAWELPHIGSSVSASDDERNAVRDAFLDAVGKNDSGFPSVDSVPLASEPPPPLIFRLLETLQGIRGAIVGTLVVLAIVLVSDALSAAVIVGVFLFALGIVLRASCLDLPFGHDQDVQRLFTGHLPLREIATGAGLQDRHPPLYFFLLHLVEKLGQSEEIVRAPAVVAGSLVGPSLVLATALLCGGVGPGPLLVALAVTICPELILRSREVSEIPLYALIMIGATTALLLAIRRANWKPLVSLAIFNALALFTYYLSLFLMTANALALAFSRSRSWRVAAAFCAGLVIGSPAIVLAGATLLRDWGAREVAHNYPTLAWGEHTPIQMARQMVTTTSDAFGIPLLLLVILALAVGIRRRDPAMMTLTAGALATFLGIALLSPIARVQGYYFATALPILALPLAILAQTDSASLVLPIGLVVALSSIPRLGNARLFYLPDVDAFMPRFAQVIAQRPESNIVTVAHYDATLVSYYLARLEKRPVDWDTTQMGSKHIEPLVMVHFFDATTEQSAADRLKQIIATSPTLVVDRDSVTLPSVVDILSTCEILAEAPTGRLWRCPATG